MTSNGTTQVNPEVQNSQVNPEVQDPEPQTQVKLAEYARYEDAQAAVDRLSDEGFPVRTVSIVWSRLRRVEHVTGRRSWPTAARDGALTGLWFGGFLGLLLSLFVELDEGISALGVVVWYAVVGALLGAVFVVVRHAALRGRRDFTTRDRLDAEAFEVWVGADWFDRAAVLLGRGGAPPADPDSTTGAG